MLDQRTVIQTFLCGHFYFQFIFQKKINKIKRHIYSYGSVAFISFKSRYRGLSSVCSRLHTLCLSDLISQLLDPVVDPWLDRETCYDLIPVPESYNGPRLSFPLSVSDTNALLSAFKEQQVQNTGLNLLIVLFRCWLPFSDSQPFFHAVSTCQICAAAVVRDQEAPQTDAQHHPLVDILHRDYYMW